MSRALDALRSELGHDEIMERVQRLEDLVAELRRVERINPDALYSTKAAAALLGLSHRTLEGYRNASGLGNGPRYSRLRPGDPTSTALYKGSDLLAWIDSRPTYRHTCEERLADRKAS